MLRTAPNISNSTNRVPAHSSRLLTSASFARFLLKREHISPVSCSAVLRIICGYEWFFDGGFFCWRLRLQCIVIVGSFLKLLKLHKLVVVKLDISRGGLTRCHAVLDHGLNLCRNMPLRNMSQQPLSEYSQTRTKHKLLQCFSILVLRASAVHVLDDPLLQHTWYKWSANRGSAEAWYQPIRAAGQGDLQQLRPARTLTPRPRRCMTQTGTREA